MKKTALLLLISMLASLAVSCGGDPSGSNDTTTTEAATTTEAPIVYPDYGGRSFRVALSPDSIGDIEADTQTGEITNDALYDRNVLIEERYKVKLEPTLLTDDVYGFYKALSTLVLADEDVYDIAGHYAYQVQQAISADIYVDWNTTSIDSTAEWWAASINENATFNNKLYAISGYLGMSMMQRAYAMFFNTRICEENGITDQQLYKLVYDGQWTFDKFSAMVKDVYADINSDNQVDNFDLFGFGNTSGNGYDLWQTAFDLPITSKNSDGTLTELVLSDKRASAIAKMADFFHNNQGVRMLVQDSSINLGSASYEQYNFSQGRQMFCAGTFSAAYTMFRDMDDAYSIVPIPKWDDKQEEYMTHLNDRYTIWGIPKTATDVEFVATIADALAQESYKSVYPAFYDIALKTKYSQDEDCANMVDIAMKGMRFDVAFMFGEYMERAPYLFRDLIKENNTNLASTYESKKTAMHEKLETLWSFYE